MPEYDNKFFEYINSGSISSARETLPTVMSSLRVTSVLDVGCGQGAWLSVWRELGVEDVLGIDGDYVNREMLQVPPQQFVPADLRESFRVERKFDLVQSLEVAEHLPASRAQGFIEDIVSHGDIAMFSAAPKGQGGNHHINEQSYEYWRSLFRAHNFEVLDCIRPAIAGIQTVEPWYRYNIFLYVHQARLATLPKQLQSTRIQADTKLRDISPLLYQAQKNLVRLLPVSLVTRIAKRKEVVVARSRKEHG